ncbi:MAG: TadE/TadG family type IV pilus assembly protein [Acidimicrobiia bacterium]
MTRRLADERGAAVVEFALVSVLFLGILFGIVTFGLIFMVKNDITRAAEAGARAAIAGTTVDGAGGQRDKAYQAAQRVLNGLPSSYEDHIVLPADTSPADGIPDFPIAPCPGETSASCITVTVTYPYSSHPLVPAVPLLGEVLPDEITSTSVVQLTN